MIALAGMPSDYLFRLTIIVIQAIRSLWLTLDRRLRVHDELDMASTRLRKMTREEVYSGREISFAIHPNQVTMID